MRRNKRVKQCSQFAVRSVQVAVLILSAFTMMMAYLSKDQCCTSIQQEIKKAEDELKKLEGEYQREAARWEELRTLENIDRQLVYFGAEMQLPQPEQVVRMGDNGRPVPGQLSVLRAQARAQGGREKQLAAAAPRQAAQQVQQPVRQVAQQPVRQIAQQPVRQVAQNSVRQTPRQAVRQMVRHSPRQVQRRRR